MFPFWDIAIAPVIKASGARRVVEIGALKGETTARMFEQLGPESELHVIDPLPQFDPAEHEAAFPGRYQFHRGLSHDVLPGLPAVDVALVDGDHNWYTVFHELRMLHDTARAAGQLLPVLVLHDVGWPYGRRDLYYEPSRIPEEWRQPWRRAGIHPKWKNLMPKGGMNRTLANAEREGGARNGVRTGFEDFLAGYDRPVRVVHLPIYFGLIIAVDEQRLRDTPALAAVLDHLESPDGQQELLELSERLRIDAVIFEQSYARLLRSQIEAGAERELALLTATLAPAPGPERDRLDHLHRLVRSLVEAEVPGDLVDATGDPATSVVLGATLRAFVVPGRQVLAVGGPAVADAVARLDLADRVLTDPEPSASAGSDAADGPAADLPLALLVAPTCDRLGAALARHGRRLAPGAAVVVTGAPDGSEAAETGAVGAATAERPAPGLVVVRVGVAGTAEEPAPAG